MKRTTFPLLVILMLAAMVATTSTPAAAILPENGASAFGAGQFTYINPDTARPEIWSFSFEAIANKNGQARGRAHFENLTAQKQIVVRINCLSVQSINFPSGMVLDAGMTGKVLHTDFPHLPKSTTVAFAAFDGLLPMFGSDSITPVFEFPFPELDCSFAQPLTILAVENGDIEIQP
jgi:hypothetical protein